MTGGLHAHGPGRGAAADRRRPRDARAAAITRAYGTGTTLVVATVSVPASPGRSSSAWVRRPGDSAGARRHGPDRRRRIAATRLRGTGPAADAAPRVPSDPEPDPTAICRVPVPPPLVDATTLRAALGHPDLVLLDASFDLTGPRCRRERDWAAGHVPGALYAHLDRDLCGPQAAARAGFHWAAPGCRVPRSPATVGAGASRPDGSSSRWTARRPTPPACGGCCWLRPLPGLVLGTAAYRRVEAGGALSSEPPAGPCGQPYQRVPARCRRSPRTGQPGRLAERVVDARAGERSAWRGGALDSVAGHVPHAEPILQGQPRPGERPLQVPPDSSPEFGALLATSARARAMSHLLRFGRHRLPQPPGDLAGRPAGGIPILAR